MKNRAEKCIAQGCLTNSKHWSSYVEGVYPTHISASSGAHLIDTSNKKYIDMICGLGTNLLGYGHPIVENEVETLRFQGKSPSLPHSIEVETAEQLKQVFPWVEKWKFLKSGSEACTAAIRMSRAYSEKRGVSSEGYHGWHDIFTALTPPAYGCISPEELKITKIEEPNLPPIDSAACILEPVIIDDSPSRISWLKELRDHCTKNNIVLIFDEVITAFRYTQHSVSKAYNIRPDLIIIGKSMANGYPLAAVGGPSKIMDSNYFVSSTYAGEISSLMAAKTVSKIIRENPNYNINHLLEAGKKFLTEFNQHSKPLGFEIKGYETRGIFQGDDLMIALFMQQACKADILFGKSWFISHAHIPRLYNLIESCKDILLKMSKTVPKLEGKLPRSPLSMKARQ